MKIVNTLLIVLFLSGIPGVCSAKDFDDSEITGTDFPQWFINSEFLDLSDDLDAAISEGRKGLMVLFTTEGCSYCSVFIQKSLGDPEIAKLVQQNFGAIGMEIFDDTEMVSPWGKSLPVKVFAKQEGVMFSPTVLFYDTSGKQILRKTGYLSPERFQNTLDYVINGHYRSESYASFMKRMQQQLVSTTMHEGLMENPHFDQPPYALDRSRFPASKPLLVLFEKNNCDECVNFHEQVLNDDAVDSTLNEFQVVRLDAEDRSTPVLAPDGKRTTPAQWYQQAEFSRVPAMILIDPKGNESMKTDALVLQQRMMNSLNYMLEGAYEKGWTYQRFARSKAIARSLARQQVEQGSIE